MKNLSLFILFFLTFSTIKSQDIIVTHDNEFLEVDIISSDSSLTFYRVKGDSEIRIIENDNIKLLQKESQPYKPVNISKSFLEDPNFEANLASKNLYLEKKRSQLSLLTGLTGLAFGSVTLLEWKSSNESDETKKSICIMTLTTFTLGVVSLGALNRFSYRIKRIDLRDSPLLSQEVLSLQQKKYVKSPYLSVANSGLGIQLNF